MRLRTKLRDWWRGYTDADMRSLLTKLDGSKVPGEITPLTRREYKALLAHSRGQK